MLMERRIFLRRRCPHKVTEKFSSALGMSLICQCLFLYKYLCPVFWDDSSVFEVLFLRLARLVSQLLHFPAKYLRSKLKSGLSISNAKPQIIFFRSPKLKFHFQTCRNMTSFLQLKSRHSSLLSFSLQLIRNMVLSGPILITAAIPIHASVGGGLGVYYSMIVCMIYT